VHGWKHRDRQPETQEDHDRIAEVAKYAKYAKEAFPPLSSVYSNYEDLMPNLYENVKWNKEPPFTSYATWKGVIDYIFVWPIEDGIVPMRIKEIPPEDYIKEYVALPNDLYGSDHFFIQCEFVLNKRSE
jgi:mRNA deadenylase 3'-5' endonuclease subunit Ccr4